MGGGLLIKLKSVTDLKGVIVKDLLGEVQVTSTLRTVRTAVGVTVNEHRPESARRDTCLAARLLLPHK